MERGAAQGSFLRYSGNSSLATELGTILWKRFSAGGSHVSLRCQDCARGIAGRRAASASRKTARYDSADDAGPAGRAASEPRFSGLPDALRRTAKNRARHSGKNRRRTAKNFLMRLAFAGTPGK